MTTSLNTSLHIEPDATFVDNGACRPGSIALHIDAGDGHSYATIFISPAKAVELARWLIEAASECGVAEEAEQTAQAA